VVHGDRRRRPSHQPQRRRAARAPLRDRLLDHGVVKAHEKFFVSTAHGDDEVAATITAFDAAGQELGKEKP
jgi:glutamate-1-semialdehyde aminotransferase